MSLADTVLDREEREKVRRLRSAAGRGCSMKRSVLFVALLLSVSVLAEPLKTYDQLITRDGYVYENVRVVAKMPHDIVIYHSDGKERLSFEQLPDYVLRDLGFPPRATLQASQRTEVEKELQRQRDIATRKQRYREKTRLRHEEIKRRQQSVATQKEKDEKVKRRQQTVATHKEKGESFTFLELVYLAMIAWAIACVSGSLWGLFEPFSFAKFMENVPAPIGTFFWLTAVAGWSYFIGKGSGAVLPDMGTVLNEYGEQVQRNVSVGQAIGFGVGWMPVLLIIQLRYNYAKRQERERGEN